MSVTTLCSQANVILHEAEKFNLFFVNILRQNLENYDTRFEMPQRFLFFIYFLPRCFLVISCSSWMWNQDTNCKWLTLILADSI